jgi:hypothetical protein
VKQAYPNIVIQRIVSDHTNTWLELDLSVRWTWRPLDNGLPASQRGIYELQYKYPNVGDCKRRTGLSPLAAYPSIVEHCHIQRFPYTRAPRPCIKKLPVHPSGLWPYGSTSIGHGKTRRNDEPPPQLSSNSNHISCMND